MKNAGWLFYRAYYEKELTTSRLENFVKEGKLDPNKENFFDSESKALINFKWDSSYKQYFPNGNSNIPLTTTYPGLLIGTGYSHQTGSTGEFKSGFFFDHTTGLPVIPGSSVKGVLRSVFPNRDKSENEVLKGMKARFIHKLLASIGVDIAEKDVEYFENLIFEGRDKNGNPLPMYEHDVFLDAYISNTSDKDGYIFEEDFITPHGENPLKNPTPIRFLKIRGGVTLQFCFDLKGCKVDNLIITADQKKQLFELILKKIGVGAKTNVGYGQFQ
jgi:CRISPR-associated protein Cmr6